MTNCVLDALEFRHACKAFDPERKIADDTLRDIIEAARLSPSSFGLEPWKFLVISNPDRSDTLEADHPYVRACYDRKGLPEEKVEASIARYGKYLAEEVKPRMSLYAWASKQCYIALADIMTAAAAAGVDSCPIEGFTKTEVDRVLTAGWCVSSPPPHAMIAPFIGRDYDAGR